MANGEKKMSEEMAIEHRNVCMMCRMHGHAHGGMHGEGMCGVCHGANHYFLLRILLALMIVAFVFWAGVMVGMMVGGGDWEHKRGYGGYGYDEYGRDYYYNEFDDYGGVRARPGKVMRDVMYYGAPGMQVESFDAALPAVPITDVEAE